MLKDKEEKDVLEAMELNDVLDGMIPWKDYEITASSLLWYSGFIYTGVLELQV